MTDRGNLAGPRPLRQAPAILLGSVKLVVFDFDGVMTDNTVYVAQTGEETVRCWRSDGFGLARLRRCGVALCILSTEVNPVVSVRADKLGLPCLQGCEDKGLGVSELADEIGVELTHTAFVGNDINDLPAWSRVGLRIAVADAYPEVFPQVTYITERAGGYGAVREVCDCIAAAIESSRLAVGRTDVKPHVLGE